MRHKESKRPGEGAGKGDATQSTSGSPGKTSLTQSLPVQQIKPGQHDSPDPKSTAGAPWPWPPPFTLDWYRQQLLRPPSSIADSEQRGYVTIDQLIGLGFTFQSQAGLLQTYQHPRGHQLYWLLVKKPDVPLEQARVSATEGHAAVAAYLATDGRLLSLAGQEGTVEYEMALAAALESAEALEPDLAARLVRAEAARATVRPESIADLEKLIVQLQADHYLVESRRDALRAIDANGGVPPPPPPELVDPNVPDEQPGEQRPLTTEDNGGPPAPGDDGNVFEPKGDGESPLGNEAGPTLPAEPQPEGAGGGEAPPD